MIEKLILVVDGEPAMDFYSDSMFSINHFYGFAGMELNLWFRRDENSFVFSLCGTGIPRQTKYNKYFKDVCKPTEQEKQMFEVITGIKIPYNTIEITVDKEEELSYSEYVKCLNR